VVEAIRTSLRESKAARWTALSVVAFTMMCGYFIGDVMSPLKPLLEQQLGWNSNEYGFFTSAYGWFNVFLLMLILGGIVLDKMGMRFTGVTSALVMIAGTAIKYFALSTHALDGATLLGWKAQVMVAAIGFAVFGVGVEVAGITSTKIIVKWFKGKEIALAMGLQLATARVGTAIALGASPLLAVHFKSVAAPVLLGLVFLCIGLLSFLCYCVMDRRLDASEAAAGGAGGGDDAFRLSDIGLIIRNRGFWYIASLCVLFYSAVFPFLKYASDLMVQKFHVQASLAGIIPSVLPFGTILLTPLFGNLYDRKGRGATIMILGSCLLILVHALFTLPFLTWWPAALALTVVLGVGFSLVPSAMWPSVPKIIPEKQLGTAYALIFWVQNWGLMGVPALIGWVLYRFCVTGQAVVGGQTVVTYNYTLPMMIFTGFAVLSLLFAFLLKAEDRKKGYGLEARNL